MGDWFLFTASMFFTSGRDLRLEGAWEVRLAFLCCFEGTRERGDGISHIGETVRGRFHI